MGRGLRPFGLRGAAASPEKPRPGRMRPRRPPSSRDNHCGLAADEVVIMPCTRSTSPAPRMLGPQGRQGAADSGRSGTFRSTWRISTALGRRADRCRLSRCSRSPATPARGGSRHRRQRPLSSRPWVRQWLERPDCRITLVFLPAYAPHLNAIERLWAVMHREVTHNRFHPTSGTSSTLSSISSADDCHKSGQNGEIPSPISSGSYPTRIFGFWSELGICCFIGHTLQAIPNIAYLRLIRPKPDRLLAACRT